MFEDILLVFLTNLCLWLLFAQWHLREDVQHLSNRVDLLEYETTGRQHQAEARPVIRGET